MFARYVSQTVEAALADTRVVLVEGPRQAGKTTLVKGHCGPNRRYLSLDDQATRALAQSDPTTFIRDLDVAVIDEIQRAPELLLAIKMSVDTDSRPGRFLLTGSASHLALASVADSLAGRMEIIQLLPLSQAEILGTPSTFLKNVFQGKVPTVARPVLGEALVQLVLAGGYPEAIARSDVDRRYRWHETYIRSQLLRDVRDIADVEDLTAMPRLLQVLSVFSAQLLNFSKIGALLQVNHKTAKRYVDIFEQMHLVRMLPAWSANRLNRLVKAPKVHFYDTGLVAALLDLDLQTVGQDRKRFGALLESFVFAEICKLCCWHPRHVTLSHFRDKDGQHEVDLVLEGPGGAVVGLEVKAAATVSRRDFAGLKQLAEVCGEKFKLGLLLYDHDVVLPYADKIFAVPLSALWS